MACGACAQLHKENTVGRLIFATDCTQTTTNCCSLKQSEAVGSLLEVIWAVEKGLKT